MFFKLKNVINNIFILCIIIYLTLYLIDNIWTGFVSNNFKISIFILPIMLIGWLNTLLNFDNKKDINKKIININEYILIIFLSVIGGILVYFKVDTIFITKLILSTITTFLIFCLSILTLIPNDKFVKKIYLHKVFLNKVRISNKNIMTLFLMIIILLTSIFLCIKYNSNNKIIINSELIIKIFNSSTIENTEEVYANDIKKIGYKYIYFGKNIEFKNKELTIYFNKDLNNDVEILKNYFTNKNITVNLMPAIKGEEENIIIVLGKK